MLTDGEAQVRTWTPPFPVDVPLVLGVHRHGGGDPTYRAESGAIWRTSLTPDGPATMRVTVARPVVTAQAWGPGAAWLLEALPALLGADDPGTADLPADARGAALLADIASRHEGLRIGRSKRVLEALVPAILEQKVVSKEAHRAWHDLLYRFGTRAPGPGPASLRVFPSAQTWASIPTWEWHRAGVEGVRARTSMNAARLAARLEPSPALAHEEADRRLRTLPGIGQWTSAEVRQRACGDPDALSVGDYNLPKLVGWTLAGQRNTDDAGMLDLLEPYKGQRYRVQRLLELGGSSQPRRGPRMSVRDYRGF
jgi:3-methyladenine DNA glycosylase/8-oxoguanine DNA glycosylase